MSKNGLRFFLSTLLLLGLGKVPGAEAGKNVFKILDDIEIHGFVSSSYTYNTNRPLSQTNCGNPSLTPATPGCQRIFDVDDNSFKLDVAELVFLKDTPDTGDIGFRFDLTFGYSLPEVAQRPGSSATAAAPGPLAPGDDDFDIQQGFVSWKAPIGKGLQIDMGKFVTHVGAEVFEGFDGWNTNFSRTFVFGWGIPFTHTGLRASYQFNDEWSFMFMVANNWEAFGVADNNSGKSIGTQVGYSPMENVGILFNWMGGNEGDPVAGGSGEDNWRNIFDVVIDIGLTDKLSMQLNLDLGTLEKGDPVDGKSGTWWGIAGYLRYDVNNWFSMNFRGAHFNDADGVNIGVYDNKLWEVTVTPEFRIHENMVVRFEYRHDQSNLNVFENRAGLGTDNQDTFAMNALIHF